MTPDREPVGQAVNAIIQTLDVIACMALTPKDYDEVAVEEESIKFIKRRAELILRLIKSRKPPPQLIPERPKLRVVK